MALDEHGRPLGVPKPVSTKKKKGKGSGGKTKKPAKSVNMDAVDAKIRERNNINRGFGKTIEKRVAALLGGVRIPMSGAIKNGNFGLVGDVRINHRGTALALIECKGSSSVTASGDKTFTVKLPVLKQIEAEAASVSAWPALFIHWRSANYETDDYIVLPVCTYVQIAQDIPFMAFVKEEGIMPRGDKTYTLKKSDLDVYVDNAREAQSYPAVRLTWKDGSTYVIIPVRAYIDMLDGLRTERDAELDSDVS